MRSISPSFVVAPPSGARIRTRLRVDAADQQVLRAVGEQLGRLASADVAVRCRLGRSNDQWADRKRALTAASSSRWAGAITRTSNDQWERATKNLLDARAGLRRAIRRLRARLGGTVGRRQGRTRGYASGAERFAKQRRLQQLQARLAEVEARIARGRVSVCRGGRRLARLRHALGREDVSLTEAAWRERWQAARWFLTADGEAGKRWGNETIRVHPDQGWLELRLPAPLARLSNTPGRAATYRLSCPVVFHHRAAEWAAQAATGAVRYDLWSDPGRGRWYADASWQLPARAVPSLAALRQDRALGVDLNAEHLDGWVLDRSGNPVGAPHTIPLHLEGLPASTRDGRLRAAVAALIRLAKTSDCRSVMVEDLDFGDARQVGREALGRGRHWRAPLNQSTRSAVTVSRHHAAAVVIGRRGLGLGARRRPGVPQAHQNQRMGTGELPARPDYRVLGRQGPGPPGGQRAAAPPRRTRRAERAVFGDQVAQDRPVPPVSADRR